jgi:thioredoxin 1
MRLFKPVAMALIATVVAIAPAFAAEVRDFSRAAFDAAQAQDRPILVEVKAWWCPVCASQSGTIRKSIAGPEYAKLVVFQINYDKQKSEWQAFDVKKQGTLIAFRGIKQLGRLDFVTDKPQIRNLLALTVR